MSIERKEKIDFIATAISGWHLGSIYSFLKSLKKPLRGIIYIEGSRITSKMIVDFKDIKIEYVYIDSHKKYSILKMIKTLRKVKNTCNEEKLWILSPFGYNLGFFQNILENNRSRNFILVKYDEGIGTYLSDYTFNLSYTKNRFIDKINVFIKLLIKKIVIKKMKKNKIQFGEFFLFNKENEALIENPESVVYFHDVYMNHLRYSVDYTQNQILIFKDLMTNRLSLEETNEFYYNLIKKITQTTNKIVYIKKHPADFDLTFDDKMSEFPSVAIINEKLDAEMIYSSLSPSLTMGGVSTCAFSISVLFRDKVYNFSNEYSKYKISKDFANEILSQKNYFGNFSNVIYIDDLNEFISKIGGKDENQ